MKKSTFYILALLLSILFSFACKKDEKKTASPSGPSSPSSPAPLLDAPDSIASITKDFAFATLCIADLEQMMGMASDDYLFYNFYVSQGGSSSLPTETVTAVRDSLNSSLYISFNNVICIDGKKRNGTVFLNYKPTSDPTPRYYSLPSFTSKLQLFDYKVDGWLIKQFDQAQLPKITNTTPYNFDPTQRNITWSIEGKFKFYHPTDPTRDLIWDGTIIKTLINTNDPSVVSHSNTQPVNWPLAKVEYKGNITGMRDITNAFSYSIDGSHPLFRNFSCAVSPASFTLSNQLHPFISGITTLTLNGHPAQIMNYNDALNSATPLCDDSGTVKVNSKMYAIHF